MFSLQNLCPILLQTYKEQMITITFLESMLGLRIIQFCSLLSMFVKASAEPKNVAKCGITVLAQGVTTAQRVNAHN